MEKGLKKLITILLLFTIVELSFMCGYLYGEFNTLLHVSNSFVIEDIQDNLNNTPTITYINNTCEIDIIKTKINLYAEYSTKGYLDATDLTFN